MAQHINQKANKGQGHTLYLSNMVCEEFIHLMAKRVLQNILDKLKASKYFSVSVDSTPDISHVDQLTCILRYVLPSDIRQKDRRSIISSTGKDALSNKGTSCLFVATLMASSTGIFVNK
jgi:hypothetical protein